MEPKKSPTADHTTGFRTTGGVWRTRRAGTEALHQAATTIRRTVKVACLALLLLLASLLMWIATKARRAGWNLMRRVVPQLVNEGVDLVTGHEGEY